MADNTASLVVALSAQLTKFEKDMRSAGIMAEKATKDIEDKFSKIQPSINASFFGNLFSTLTDKALSGAVEAVKALVDRFKELQAVSKYTELSLQWLYGLQQAGQKAGSTFGDINIAVKAIAFSLDEMKRGGDNALKTLLDANPQLLKGANRDALTLAQTLGIIQDALAGARNTIQAVDIAKNLGIPESVVEGWRQGGAAVKQIADEAARGAPNLAILAEQSKLLGVIWESITKSAKDSLLSGFFAQIITDVQLLKSVMESLLPLFEKIGLGARALGSIEELKAAETAIQAARAGKPAGADVAQTRIAITGGTTVDPFARKTAAAGETASAYERETNAINKQIATMQAENATLGESAHAQEEYRVQLILSEKAAQDGKQFTQALNDEIAVTAERAATAKQALAEHTFALQRLNSASQQVGSALSTAFADAIVEGKSLNDVMQSLIKTLEKAAINALVMNLFTPGAGGSLSPVLSSLGIGHAAGGADNWRGGPLVVGERGPELVNLPRGSQVIPNDVARNMAAGGGVITYAPAIDARGASVEAVARLAQIMEADRASFASRTVATIQMARRGRVPGL
jgi:hypothetical protein